MMHLQTAQINPWKREHCNKKGRKESVNCTKFAFHILVYNIFTAFERHNTISHLEFDQITLHFCNFSVLLPDSLHQIVAEL